MRILPTKEELEVSRKLEPYTYFENLTYCLKEDAPEEAKELWNKHLKLKKIRDEAYMREMLL